MRFRSYSENSSKPLKMKVYSSAEACPPPRPWHGGVREPEVYGLQRQTNFASKEHSSQGKGIENLTDLNLQISEAVNSLAPKRVVLDILSDILLRHKALQTRKWLAEFLERLRSKYITALAVVNPRMHADEEVQAVVSLFDGNLEIVEEEGKKSLRVNWMHGIDVTEKQLSLDELTVENSPIAEVLIPAVAFREPRWLTPW